MLPSVARLVTVQLVRQSLVVPGGIRHERWEVLYGGRWQDPELLPGAVVTEFSHTAAGRSEDAAERRLPPGCQYRLDCELRLPVGTLLDRIVSEPRTRQPAAGEGFDPLSYLRRGHNVRLQRSSVKRRMQVVGNYRVVPCRRRRASVKPELTQSECVSASAIEDFAQTLR